MASPPLPPGLTATEQRRYQAALAALGAVGLVRRGTLLARRTSCGNPHCRCRADPPQLHGPYWQWTRKVDGRTVTSYLSDEQADWVATWLANGHQLDRALGRLTAETTRITDRLLAARSRR